MSRSLPLVLVLSALALSCAGAGDKGVAPPPKPSAVASTTELPKVTEPAPLGRLPADVRPKAYALELEIVPWRDRFRGVVDIEVDLAQPRNVIWMHGRGLKVSSATVKTASGETISGDWQQVHETGVASLRLPKLIGAGKYTVHLVWDAPFSRHYKGLYRVERGPNAYAFTQFESISAREAFPCFDEPAFKTKFDLDLVIPEGTVAIANEPEIKRSPGGAGLVRVEFASSAPLPTYLVAFAVGNLDVVEGKPIPVNAVRTRPVPLRGVAVKGRGPDLAYALENTGAIVSLLEEYFGLEYPYRKLDILAVPEKDGAMENPGAITFSEYLLLMDPKTAPLQQKRAFVGVTAHELAHQWFGDLVTMPWWDDIWLNEAFATWMGTRTTAKFQPDTQAEVFLLDRIHDTMGADALVSARAIRQPIESAHDIINAFDGITYQKGAAVLSMFERWIGKDAFRKGIQAYLKEESKGDATATATELYKALGVAANRDVATPFKSFVDQPGVPFVSTRVTCVTKAKTTPTASIVLTQSRYLPLGTSGDAKKLWQIPICARYAIGKEIKESCTLLTTAEGSLPLEGKTCPEWVMPNADGAGYYRFSLTSYDVERLTKNAWPHLTVREKLAIGDSLRASFSRGTSPATDVFPALSKMAKEPFPSVASQPMGMYGLAREWLWDDPLRSKVEASARKLYAAAYKDLGLGQLDAKGKADDPDRIVLRQSVVSFLAYTGQDPTVRKELAKRARLYLGIGGDNALHVDAIDGNLVGTALAIGAQEGTEDEQRAFFDAALAHLAKTEDVVLRGRLIGALGSVRTKELAARSRALAFDARLRVNETMWTVNVQLDMLETREDAWAWVKQNFDAIVARISTHRAGGLPYAASRFCDGKHALDAETFFTPRIQPLEGGPRNLASVLERIKLCAARRDAQEKSVRAFFEK